MRGRVERVDADNEIVRIPSLRLIAELDTAASASCRIGMPMSSAEMRCATRARATTAAMALIYCRMRCTVRAMVGILCLYRDTGTPWGGDGDGAGGASADSRRLGTASVRRGAATVARTAWAVAGRVG
jgi:hypothetical protein